MQLTQVYSTSERYGTHRMHQDMLGRESLVWKFRRTWSNLQWIKSSHKPKIIHTYHASTIWHQISATILMTFHQSTDCQWEKKWLQSKQTRWWGNEADRTGTEGCSICMSMCKNSFAASTCYLQLHWFIKILHLSARYVFVTFFCIKYHLKFSQVLVISCKPKKRWTV